MSGGPALLYGDFSCPWSYLSYRRLAMLRAAGQRFELRAVEHDPWHPGSPRGGRDELAALQGEMDEVVAHLLPDEDLPYTLAGFVPHTRAAISGYAESHGANVADVAAPVLFEAFWRHGVDISDPRTVRTLLAEALMSGSSTSDPLRRWGHAVDVTGGPMTTTGWRLVRDWRREWHDLEHEVVPVLVLDDGPVFGVDAVDRLGTMLADSDVDPARPVEWPRPGRRPPVDRGGRRQVLYPPPHVA